MGQLFTSAMCRLKAADIKRALKGHDFSRAASASESDLGFSPPKSLFSHKGRNRASHKEAF